MTNGKIGVTTENIFPVIKQFLYSDHEIFLREIISNAVDATQKLRTLSSKGIYTSEEGKTDVRVELDSKNKTLSVVDRGIGMSSEEVNKYINDIAFSGAEEFLEKYKNASIIGHFGLGFYSSFMVSDKVEIFTQSYDESKPSVHWQCEGTPEYKMEELKEKLDRGTRIVLHISDDCKEYLEQSTISDLLKKYCQFLPVEIVFGKKKEWKDGKYQDTEEDNIINDTTPLWTKKPSDIKDEQYVEFYKKLYPMSDDPLFWIHLNIDYPFNLTGVLYFPKIHNNFEIQKNKIRLYSNQVFVTDQVEGIVPEYLTLLHGVIDSPDIPLNVSRSYLQSDSNVKKISSYITRKVCDRLVELFKQNRDEYTKKWDDLKIFIQYGILSDEKFAEKAPQFTLLKNTEGKYFTQEEYLKLVKDNQTDKDKMTVLLYVDDPVAKLSYVESAKSKGYDVLHMDGQLDSHYMGWFEQKNEKTHFARVDSDIIDRIIRKEDERALSLTEDDRTILTPVFESQIPHDDKANYDVQFAEMGEDAQPIVITQDEYMRRMKDMSQMGGGMAQFYAQMPDRYTLTVNASHPLLQTVLSDTRSAYGTSLEADLRLIDDAKQKEKDFEKLTEKKKEEELTQEEKDMRSSLSKAVVESRDELTKKLSDVASKNEIVRQLIDLALLQNGLLKGENLSKFIKRSVSLIR
ncbi:MAG: molecular chaperone HtpG [Alistipes sp.]|nr:molecular chaperone HtpG [Candidatus Alistipes equi]